MRTSNSRLISTRTSFTWQFLHQLGEGFLSATGKAGLMPPTSERLTEEKELVLRRIVWLNRRLMIRVL
jgi:hypothetical protein